MGEVYLTVVEAAELKKCSTRNVQKLLQEGKLASLTVERKGRGNATLEYRIPLSALVQSLQLKNKRKQFEALDKALNADGALVPFPDLVKLLELSPTTSMSSCGIPLSALNKTLQHRYKQLMAAELAMTQHTYRQDFLTEKEREKISCLKVKQTKSND